MRIARLAILAIWMAAGTALSASGPSSTGETKAVNKVVVHIDFGDVARQKHGLGNVENMLKASKEGLQVEVVAHGEGLAMLVKGKTKAESEIRALEDKGVKFVACENTMKKESVTSSQLVEGVGTVPSGALEVVAMQADGYSYFKP